MTDTKATPAKAAAAKTPATVVATTKSPRVAPQLSGASPIALSMPAKPVASKSIYPFDSLAAPMRNEATGEITAAYSFGVMNKTARELAQVVSTANKRYRREIGEGENKTTVEDRHFFAVDCDPATDPEGAKARVYRDK